MGLYLFFVVQALILNSICIGFWVYSTTSWLAFLFLKLTRISFGSIVIESLRDSLPRGFRYIILYGLNNIGCIIILRSVYYRSKLFCQHLFLRHKIAGLTFPESRRDST